MKYFALTIMFLMASNNFSINTMDPSGLRQRKPVSKRLATTPTPSQKVTLTQNTNNTYTKSISNYSPNTNNPVNNNNFNQNNQQQAQSAATSNLNNSSGGSGAAVACGAVVGIGAAAYTAYACCFKNGNRK